MTPQQLKNAILQQAIQGKLVEQRAEEGTGQELFEAIQEEKEKLIEEGKLKKQKILPQITADEIPFEIPETWKWVRLGDSLDVRDGTHDTPKYVTKGYPLVTSKNLKNGIIDFDNCKYISELDFIKISERSKVDRNDILFAMIGSIGNPVLVLTDTKFSIKNMALFKNISSIIDMRYLYWFLFFSQETMKKKASGGVQSFVSLKFLREFLFPLPPLAEQERIVEKIEELLPLVERYEKAWARLEELNKKFPLYMQKAILGQAIQGKLVDQRAEEGTGQELYKAIQDEKKKLIEEGKLKKQKALPDITEDEIPFDIPETWKWVRLGEISTYSQTKTKINVAEIETPMWSLDLEDIEKESGKIIRRVMTNERKISGEKIFFKKEQILYSKLRPYLKKILIAPDKGVCSSELVPFDMIGNCDSKFIVYVLKSAYVDFLINSVTYGVKMPRVGTDTMINLLIPLPPLAEQERIGDKIEELLTLVETQK